VPRYPTLPNIMKAKKKEIEALTVASLSSDSPRATTLRFYSPAKKGGGLVLEGDISALVEQLFGILKEKTAVLR
jgi:electron transfer flavoprotein beta subunit